MRSFGYLFVVLGIAALRQVAVGRVMNTPEDAKDFIVALLDGDMTTVGEVASRRGENVDVGSTEVASTSPTSTPSVEASAANAGLVSQMMKLGEATRTSAHPNGWYVWGATGPKSYDCSGLVWRALKDLGIYNGQRFTTSTFRSIHSGWAKPVNKPAVGDIVLWETQHIGVVSGSDEHYSARSPAKGIGKSTISGDTKSFGRAATFWRVTQ